MSDVPLRTDLGTIPESPVLQQFSKEQLVSRAKEYMTRTFGRPMDLEPEQRDKFYERLGLLLLYVDWVWEPFRD